MTEITDLSDFGPSKSRRGPKWFTRCVKLFALPILLVSFPICARGILPAWQFMWALSLGLFFGCKWLTWKSLPHSAGRPSEALKYGFLWVVMDPRPFVGELSHHAAQPQPGRGLFAALKCATGLALLLLAVQEHLGPPMLSAWLGMLGIVFLLHFGIFELLAIFWTNRGIAVEPLMLKPLRATSLGDFWGRRWNTAFERLAQQFAFKPLARKIGARPAMFSVFLLSGLIHDAVISFPAGGGYGLPTLYFILQALGVAAERSGAGKSLGLARGYRGKTFMLL